MKHYDIRYLWAGQKCRGTYGYETKSQARSDFSRRGLKVISIKVTHHKANDSLSEDVSNG